MGIRFTPVVIVAFILACSGAAYAETVVPLKGQSPEQIQADVAACESQSSSTTTSSATSGTPQGGRLRGAAAGAALGSATAQVRGNQYEAYDRVNDEARAVDP